MLPLLVSGTYCRLPCLHYIWSEGQRGDQHLGFSKVLKELGLFVPCLSRIIHMLLCIYLFCLYLRIKKRWEMCRFFFACFDFPIFAFFGDCKAIALLLESPDIPTHCNHAPIFLRPISLLRVLHNQEQLCATGQFTLSQCTFALCFQVIVCHFCIFCFFYS